MLRYIFSVLILAFCLFADAQTTPQALQKAPKDFKPYDLKLGVNAIRSIRTFSGSEELSTHEIQAAVAVYKYDIVVDFGVEEHKRGDSFNYINKGSYYRVGFDRNFSRNKKSGNVLSLGLRYARANFEDELMYTADFGFGEQDYLLENNSLTAGWAEVVFNVRGKVFSNFYMGFTMRWQLLRTINGEGELKAFDVPGFGKTRRQNSTAFDYYFMWRIPLRD